MCIFFPLTRFEFSAALCEKNTKVSGKLVCFAPMVVSSDWLLVSEKRGTKNHMILWLVLFRESVFQPPEITSGTVHPLQCVFVGLCVCCLCPVGSTPTQSGKCFCKCRDVRWKKQSCGLSGVAGYT